MRRKEDHKRVKTDVMRYRLHLLTRYRHVNELGFRTTYFTPLPYLQVRVLRSRYHRVNGADWIWWPNEHAPVAICLAWLFWSVRLSMGKHPRPVTPGTFVDYVSGAVEGGPQTSKA